MKIEVLGTGCPKCERLEAMAKAAADQLGVPYEITHLRDISAIVQRGVMTTPALILNGKVVVSGRLPSASELISWMTTESR